MRRYRLSITVEDEIEAEDFYKAFLKFRERWQAGFYGPQQDNVEFIGDVVEEASEPEEP